MGGMPQSLAHPEGAPGSSGVRWSLPSGSVHGFAVAVQSLLLAPDGALHGRGNTINRVNRCLRSKFVTGAKRNGAFEFPIHNGSCVCPVPYRLVLEENENAGI